MNSNIECINFFSVLIVTNIIETLYAIWYHLYNLKNVKNTHEGLLLLVRFRNFHKMEGVRGGGGQIFPIKKEGMVK